MIWHYVHEILPIDIGPDLLTIQMACYQIYWGHFLFWKSKAMAPHLSPSVSYSPILDVVCLRPHLFFLYSRERILPKNNGEKSVKSVKIKEFPSVSTQTLKVQYEGVSNM